LKNGEEKAESSSERDSLVLNGPCPPVIEAEFLDRPNRFTLICLHKGKKLKAYLPNPGRLRELLLPGSRIFLTATPPSAGRSTVFTAIGVEKNGLPVMLHTHRTNDLAGELIRRGAIPALKEYSIIRREVTVGKSRFDFLLRKDGREFILEVKSCTLFHDGVAMFPDAVTERGRRHIEELAGLKDKTGIPGGVLFIAHSHEPEIFIPDYHTDLAFSRTLLERRSEILVEAVTVQWDRDFSFPRRTKPLSIPWDTISLRLRDEGLYLLVIRLDERLTLPLPAGYNGDYPPGFYVYVGSAKKGLAKRIERHKRKRKKLHWHIDHLLKRARLVEALPIRSAGIEECRLARMVEKVTDRTIPGFGSSDCRCRGHLFMKQHNPLNEKRFIDLVLGLRTAGLKTLTPPDPR
jgi:sugar fermentation stimulation protein A